MHEGDVFLACSAYPYNFLLCLIDQEILEDSPVRWRAALRLCKRCPVRRGAGGQSQGDPKHQPAPNPPACTQRQTIANTSQAAARVSTLSHKCNFAAQTANHLLWHKVSI